MTTDVAGISCLQVLINQKRFLWLIGFYAGHIEQNMPVDEYSFKDGEQVASLHCQSN